VKVLLVDHAPKVAEKIRISGGGRCNFTNRDLDPRAPHKHFLGDNPHFCRSALSRYTPATSSRWCKSTASRSTRSTRASCSATAAPTTSSACCWPNAAPAA
jgi:predicted flavoprotein YhiN